MFILTQMNMAQGVFGVFDTSDGSNEKVNIGVLASRIRSGDIVVKGIHPYVSSDSMALQQYGISISVAEAREALNRYRYSVKSRR